MIATRRRWGRHKPPMGTPLNPALLPTLASVFWEPVHDVARYSPALCPRGPDTYYHASSGLMPAWSEYGLTFDGSDDRILFYRAAGDVSVKIQDVMSQTAKTIIARVIVTGTAASAANAFDLPLIAGDDERYLGLHRGDKTGVGDRIFAYNFVSGTEDLVAMAFPLNTDLICAMTHDGTTLKGFLEGRLVGSTASGTTNPASIDNNFILGLNQLTPQGPFAGVLRHFLVFNSVLPDDLVCALTGPEPYLWMAPPPDYRKYFLFAQAPPPAGSDPRFVFQSGSLVSPGGFI